MNTATHAPLRPEVYTEADQNAIRELAPTDTTDGARIFPCGKFTSIGEERKRPDTAGLKRAGFVNASGRGSWKHVPVRAEDVAALPADSHARPMSLVNKALAQGRMFAVVPSTLGLVCVDCDGDAGLKATDSHSPEERTQMANARMESANLAARHVKESCGEPVAETRSQSGKPHLWYRAPDGEQLGIHHFFIDGKDCGEVRHSDGYVLLAQGAPAQLRAARANAASHDHFNINTLSTNAPVRTQTGEIKSFAKLTDSMDPQSTDERLHPIAQAIVAHLSTISVPTPAGVLPIEMRQTAEHEWQGYPCPVCKHGTKDGLRVRVFTGKDGRSRVSVICNTCHDGEHMTRTEFMKALRSVVPDLPSAHDPGEKLQMTHQPVYTKQDLLRIFNHFGGISLRLNLRASNIEIRHSGSPDWAPMSDERRAQIRDLITEHVEVVPSEGGYYKRISWGREALAETMLALASTRSVDPFAEWLDMLPAWDRKPRLGDWIPDAGFEVDGSRIDLSTLAAACRMPWLGAVTRALNPGAKFDLMTILIGPQGIGKSTAWESMLPPEHVKAWFVDQFRFGDDPKKMIESCLGAVVVEAAEMVGMRKAEVETCKTFLSSRVDKERLAYRRDPQEMPRRFVLVGSSNEDEVLPNDPTGTRRFLPVPLLGGDRQRVKAWLDANRVQLWAEALHAVRHDPADAGRPYLTGEEHRLQDAHNTRFRMRNESIVNAILDVIDSLTPNDTGFTLKQVRDAASLNVSDRVMSAEARMLGCTRTRTKAGSVWIPPKG